LTDIGEWVEGQTHLVTGLIGNISSMILLSSVCKEKRPVPSCARLRVMCPWTRQVHRINYLLAQGACVVSEPSSDPALDAMVRSRKTA
jgi:hypothetical protein